MLDTDADVGIRTSTPAADLHVMHQNGTTGNGFRLENQSGNYMRFYTSSSQGALWVYSTSSPTIAIADVDPISGQWSALSDADLKTEIEPMTDVLSNVMRLKPDRYRFVHQDKSSPKQLGFLAQEVQEVFPALVKSNEESGSYTMNYSGFGVVAVAAIQEQQVIIQEMQKHILLLEERLEQLEE